MAGRKRTPREIFVEEAPSRVDSVVAALDRLEKLAGHSTGGEKEEWGRIFAGLRKRIDGIEASVGAPKGRTIEIFATSRAAE